MLVALMLELPAVSISTTERTGGHLWLAEVVATLGLVRPLHPAPAAPAATPAGG